MNSKDLVDELRKRYEEPNNKTLSETLGVSYTLVHKWHSEPRELTVKQVTNLLDKSKEQAKWEAGQDLFGKYASGDENLSANRKELLKEKIRNKKK